jgi:hypothetical protein
MVVQKKDIVEMHKMIEMVDVG